MSDILFKNVRVVDGTGAPWFRGEVLIKDGVIAEVAKKAEGGTSRVIDGKGLVLAPGFIDSHSHSDTEWFTDQRGESKIRQGVTTEVTGQCGESAAPLNRGKLGDGQAAGDSAGNVGGSDAGGAPGSDSGESGVGDTVGGATSILGAASDRASLPTWSSFDEYLSALSSNGLGVNLASLVGHGTIRIAAMGYDDRPPTSDELTRMKEYMKEAMEAGAFGFSSGLIYPPGSYASTDELVELARVMAPYGGIYATHMRDEDLALLKSVKEAIEIGSRAGVSVHISHHKVCAKHAWGQVNASLAMIDEARRNGIDVTADQYPYVATATGLSSIVPSWAHDGGPKALLARLKDPVTGAALKAKVNMDQGDDGWYRLMITNVKNDKNRACEGKRITEIAAMWGIPEVEAAWRLLCEEELEVGYVRFAMCEDDVKTVMKHPCVMIGSDASIRATDGPLSSGSPHPRAFGTFPRVLGKYCREEGLFPLETAVYKMTGLPAWRLGLWDRGLVRPGMAADLTLFDPDKVIDTATYENPKQYPVGIEYVVVNGEVVIENGEHTGVIAGKVLRRRQ